MVEVQAGPTRTSYSSFRSWLGCQERYRQTKILRAPRSPGWAMVGGSAVHLLTQWWEDEFSGASA